MRLVRFWVLHEKKIRYTYVDLDTGKIVEPTFWQKLWVGLKELL